MQKYTVQVPLVGHMIIEVEANSKNEAFELALDIEDIVGDFDTRIIELDIEPKKIIQQGNVFYGSCNRIDLLAVDNID